MTCGAAPAPVRTYRCRVFGCQVELACRGRPATGFAEVAGRLGDLDRRFTRFDPDSELSVFNASAGRWASVSPGLTRLLGHALAVSVHSGGLVNAAVLPRLVAAGYTARWPAPLAATGPGPGGDGPVEPLSAVLELGVGRARLAPGHAVDLGGIAKGLWADEVVDWLGGDAACGLGGDVACAGGGPDGAGWPVRLPDGAVLTVTNGGVATSGTARRRWGPTAHHLIDPRTGRPSCSDVDEVTVLATSAATADWVATAAVVGGDAVAGRLAGRPDVHLCRIGGPRPAAAVPAAVRDAEGGRDAG